MFDWKREDRFRFDLYIERFCSRERGCEKSRGGEGGVGNKGSTVYD